jgi:hypothetical protein
VAIAGHRLSGGDTGEMKMTIKLLEVTVANHAGSSLLMNNPQTVDPLNGFAKERAKITSLRKKTDEDILRLRELDVESKCYWDDDLGIYVPSRWVVASIANSAFSVAKIAKAKIRSSVFPTENKIKLHYAGESEVATLRHIVENEHFTTMNLKQGQVSVTKATPMFNNWHFTTQIEVDTDIVNLAEIQRIMDYGARYVGFGDFRPTFGRAEVTIAEAKQLRSAA